MANAVAKQDKVTALVSKFESSVEQAIPNHMTKEHYQRALQTAFRKTPRLTECTLETLGEAVVTSAQLGLMIGVNGAAWILPFKNNRKGVYEATLIIGYQGLIDLCYRSDRVESVIAEVVYENDTFEYELGIDQKLRHVPELEGERGKMIAAYAVGRIKGSDAPVFTVVPREEMMKIRDSSPGAKKNDSPWNGHFESEMWKKSAAKRLTKYLPKSVELAQALEFERRTEEKWATASVVEDEDDPLRPGRHEGTKRQARQETAPEAQEAEAPAGCRQYQTLAEAFCANPEQVEAAVVAAGNDHTECAMLDCFADVNTTDETMCAQVLNKYRLLTKKD